MVNLGIDNTPTLETQTGETAQTLGYVLQLNMLLQPDKKGHQL